MENESDVNISLKKLGDFWLTYVNLKSFNGISMKLMKKSSTQIKGFFNKHSFARSQSGLSEPEEFLLRQNKIVDSIDDEGKLTLTMKGLILLEFSLDNYDSWCDKFLDELNRQYFESLKGKSVSPLEAQEKGVIIALLGLLALTPKTSLKLSAYNDSYSNTESFRNCVDKSIDFLKSLGREYDDSTIKSIWNLDVRGEDPVNARLNRLNLIALRTNNIYKKSGGHYLDVIVNGNLVQGKIEILLKKIFDHNTLEYKKREEFVKLLQDIYSERYTIMDNVPDFNQLQVKYMISKCVMTLQ
jgi:hypothetical protein